MYQFCTSFVIHRITFVAINEHHISLYNVCIHRRN